MLWFLSGCTLEEQARVQTGSRAAAAGILAVLHKKGVSTPGGLKRQSKLVIVRR